MYSLGLENKSLTIYRMISELEERNKRITLDDFLDATSNMLGNTETKDGVNRMFDMFDHDHLGSINLVNISRVAKELGETMSSEELKEIVQAASSNGQEITREDLYNIMTKKTY